MVVYKNYLLEIQTGEYGISTNPESFANFGYRLYYADKKRNAVLRLSGDGITNIAAKGMSDFFKDNLNNSTTIYTRK